MTLRVGDFGMAIILNSYDEKRTTFCGTPNYLSPELIDNFNGYSFEVDYWAFGVLLYTMLIGHGPFEATTVREILKKIKKVDYFWPENIEVSDDAKSLITSLFFKNLHKRPLLD